MHTRSFSKIKIHIDYRNPRERALERLYPQIMKILLLKKGVNSLGHHNLVHKPLPIRQAMKIPDAKAQVDKEWGKHEKLPAWQVTKVKSKEVVIQKAQKEGRTVHFAPVMDVCHPLQELRVGAKVPRGDVVKDDSGSYTVFTEQRSSASQLTAVEVRTLLPHYLDAQDKQATQ